MNLLRFYKSLITVQVTATRVRPQCLRKSKQYEPVQVVVGHWMTVKLYSLY